MEKIENEKQFKAALARIEELLPLTWGDDVPEDDPKNIELTLLANLVADWEDEHVVLNELSNDSDKSTPEIINKKFEGLTISQETKDLVEGLSLSQEEMSDERTRYILGY